MAKKSIFREFIATLRKRWKKELPFIQPLTEARLGWPKASTFYAGIIKRSGQHVYLNFQHSDKAWQVGQFTINVTLAAEGHKPLQFLGAGRGPDFKDGFYRIGHFVGEKDKWWHLKQDDDPILTQPWRPSNYQNWELVLSEAVNDVTHDVLSTLRLLGARAGDEEKAEPNAAPNSRPLSQSTSSVIQESDSPRTPRSGGSG